MGKWPGRQKALNSLLSLLVIVSLCGSTLATPLEITDNSSQPTDKGTKTRNGNALPGWLDEANWPNGLDDSSQPRGLDIKNNAKGQSNGLNGSVPSAFKNGVRPNEVGTRIRANIAPAGASGGAVNANGQPSGPREVTLELDISARGPVNGSSRGLIGEGLSALPSPDNLTATGSGIGARAYAPLTARLLPAGETKRRNPDAFPLTLINETFIPANETRWEKNPDSIEFGLNLTANGTVDAQGIVNEQGLDGDQVVAADAAEGNGSESYRVPAVLAETASAPETAIPSIEGAEGRDSEVGIESITSVSCYFNANGGCNPYGRSASCTPSCSGTVGGCSYSVYNGYDYCYESGTCTSTAGCNSGGSDYKKTCYCHTASCSSGYYPCSNTCYSCGSGYTLNCYGSGTAWCCPTTTNPFYCDRAGGCWTSAQCDRAQYCGGTYVACSSATNHLNCVSGTAYCCPSSNPYYCNGYCYNTNFQPTNPCGYECDSDSDCASDYYYCSGDYVKYRNYYCSSYDCTYSTSTVVDCNTYNYWTCLDSSTRAYVTYTCSGSSSCTFDAYTDQQSCAYGCSGGACNSPTNVYGNILDEYENPVYNAKVALLDCSNNQVAYDYTDSYGDYSITAAPGSYKVKITYNSVSYITGTCPTYLSGSYEKNFQIRIDSVVYGNIINEDGNPVPGATVRLEDCSGNLEDSDTTDSYGDYSAHALAGSYKVKIVYGGFTHISDVCESFHPPDDYEKNYEITTKATVTGIVQDEDGSPLSGAVVRLRYCDGSVAASTTTSGFGSFSLSTLAGNYELEVVYNGDVYAYACSLFTPGTHNLGIIQIATQAVVTGRVINQNSQPVQGAIARFRTCAGALVTSDTTDANGNFTLDALAGQYKFEIESGGYIYGFLVGGQECYDYQPNYYSFGDIQVTTYVEVYGYVLDLNGDPVAETELLVYDCSGNYLTYTTANALGYFSLTLESGDYQIYVYAECAQGWLTDDVDTCLTFTVDSYVSIELPCSSCQAAVETAVVRSGGDCYGTIRTDFDYVNTCDEEMSYDIVFKLYSPGGSVLQQQTKHGLLSLNDEDNFDIYWYPPTGGWGGNGNYKVNAAFTGTCDSGTKTLSTDLTTSISNCASTCTGYLNFRVMEDVGQGQAIRLGGARVTDGTSTCVTDGTYGECGPITVSKTTCGYTVPINVYCPDNKLCKTTSVKVDSNGDTDDVQVYCDCLANTGPSLSAYADFDYPSHDFESEFFYKGEDANFDVEVYDNNGHVASSYLTTVDTMVSQSGKVTPMKYLSTGEGAYTTKANVLGLRQMTFIPYKSGYRQIFPDFVDVYVKDYDAMRDLHVTSPDGVPLAGVLVKVDYGNNGEFYTDTNGYINLPLSRGQHNIIAYCDNGNTCGETFQIGDETVGEINVLCDCNDCDLDGYSDEFEELVETGKCNPNDTPAKAMADSMKCVDTGALRDLLGDPKLWDELNKAYGSGMTGTEFLNSIENMTYTVNVSGQSLACPLSGGVGMIVGLGAGIIQGGIDDLTFIKDCAVYAYDKLQDLGSVDDDIGSFFNSMGQLGNVDWGKEFWSFYMDKFKEGRRNWVCTVAGFDAQDKNACAHGYVQGYVAGYVLEQIASTLIGAGAVKNLLTGMGIASKFGRLAGWVMKMQAMVAKVISKIKAVITGILKIGDDIIRGTVEYLQRTDGIFAKLYNLAGDTLSIAEVAYGKMVAGAKMICKKMGVARCKAMDLADDAGEKFVQSQWDDIAEKFAYLADDVGEEAAMRAYEAIGPEAMLQFTFKAGSSQMDGLSMIILRYGDNAPDILKRAVSVTGDKFNIVADGVQKGAINLNNFDNLDQVSRLVKAWNGNPFDDLQGINKHLRVYKAKGVTLVVSEQKIDGIAVLKKGSVSDEFGWEHIVDGNHHNEIKNTLGLADNDASVKEVIEEVLRDGRTLTENADAIEITKTVTRGGMSKEIKVVVSKKAKNPGSIQTAYPYTP